MTEREMEDLLWDHTERFFGEPLKKFRRQPRTDVGRPDLIFETRTGQLLVVEIKKGTASREVVGQVYDYFGALKHEFPSRSVELMVIAADIPPERRVALDRLNIEWRMMPPGQFRAVAREVGYTVESERVLRGAGEFGEFGAVEGDYGEGNGNCDPGMYLAIVRDIDENSLKVEYFYDDGTPEMATLRRGSEGAWRDYNCDASVTIDFQPSQEKIKMLKRRIAAASR